jgi:sec-independent protein translocase protein TatA
VHILELQQSHEVQPLSEEKQGFRPAQTTASSLADACRAATPRSQQLSGSCGVATLAGIFVPVRIETRYSSCVGYVSNPLHIAILLLIALLLFGGKRLPEIGRSLGTGMREFKDSISGNTPPEPPQQLAPPEATAPVAKPTERKIV